MRIVAFAHACAPGRGSEEGAGWNWACMLAQLGETVVLTRTCYTDEIEAALGRSDSPAQLRFVLVDLPAWSRQWQRGQRGVRLYYLLWQVAALRAARRLHRQRPFDLAWHLTYASAWLGSLACLVGPPFVFGPVGGGPKTPWRLLPSLGARGALYEVARTTLHLLERYLNPLGVVSWRRAALILVQDEDTLSGLPRRHRTKALVFPNAVVDKQPNPPTPRAARRTAVFAGRLLAFKGACFAIRALASRPEWRLIVCGSGPDEPRLRRLARRQRVDSRISFLGWVPRTEVLRILREEADVLVLPSLHEGAPSVVIDALSCGVPVICTDRGAPAALAGPVARTVPVTSTSRRLVAALAEQLRPADIGHRAVAHRRACELSTETRCGQLQSVIEERVNGVALLQTTRS